MAKLSETPAGEPVRSQHKRFGDLAAVWSMLARLDVAGIVDEVVPRRADAAASVGTYLALASANRVVDPCSKRGFADWWATTAGPRWVKTGRGPRWITAGSGTRWTASARPSCGEIETRLGRRMVDRVRARPVRAGAGHDQLRHLHRHRPTTRRRSPSAARPSRNAPICGWSGWRWSSPATAGCRWSPTPTPATGPTSPSSRTVVDELVARYRDLVDRRRVADRGLRRRAEHRRQPRPGRGARDRVRRLAAARRTTPTCWRSRPATTGPSTPTATPG